MGQNLLFVLARLASVILSVLTFWFGLSKAENQELNMAEGNFNTGLIRLNSLIAVCFLQAWLMWNFIVFQFKRMRETKTTSSSSGVGSASKKGKTEQEKAKARKARKEQEDSDLPEVDQKKNK